MKKIFSCLVLIFFVILSCTNRDEINTDAPINNYPPSSFVIKIDSLKDKSVILSWSKSIDPEKDSIKYDVYLGSELVKSTSNNGLKLVGLSPETIYSGKIIAKDSKNNKTEINYNFTTNKYYEKFFKEYATYNEKTLFSEIYLTSDGNILVFGKVLFDGLETSFAYALFDKKGNLIWKKYTKIVAVDVGRMRVLELKDKSYLLTYGRVVLRFNNKGDMIWFKAFGDEYDTNVYQGALENENNEIVLFGKKGSEDPMKAEESIIKILDYNGELKKELNFDKYYRSEIYDMVKTGDYYLALGYIQSKENGYFQQTIFKFNKNYDIVDEKFYNINEVNYDKFIKRNDGSLWVFGNSISKVNLNDLNLSDRLGYVGSDFKAWNFNNTSDGGFLISGTVLLDKNTCSFVNKYSSYGILEKTYIRYGVFLSNAGTVETDDKGFLIFEHHDGKNNINTYDCIIKTDPDFNWKD